MSFPESISWLLTATGALLILAGIVGGGFEVKEVKLPKLAAPARILALVFGIALVGLAVIGQLDPGPVDTGGPEAAPPIVTNMPAEEGRAILEQAGFEIGEVRRVTVWAPHDWILEQKQSNPPAGAARPAIDLVVADSDFEFEAKRSLISSDGNDVEAGITYEMRLSRVSKDRPLVARFTPRRIDLKGDGDDKAAAVLQRLVAQPGYVSIDSVVEFDPSTSWEEYSRLTSELTHEMQSQTLQSEAAAGELGASVMLMLAGMEVRFDLAAILVMTSSNGPEPATRIQLQPGSELMSEIWLEGRGESTDGGRGQAYRIFRRPPQSDNFDQIGTASYDAGNGLLIRLDMSYQVGDEDDDGLYRLQIERGK